MSAALQPDESRAKLEVKLENMKEKRILMHNELLTAYRFDKLRELNILDHHIRVASERVRGQWKVEPEQVQ
jgi:phosphate uptake regulator